MNIMLHVMCKHLDTDRTEKRFWSCFHMEGHFKELHSPYSICENAS